MPKKDCGMHAVGTYSQIAKSNILHHQHTKPNSELCSHAHVTKYPLYVSCMCYVTT
jgi:hypothetical protein